MSSKTASTTTVTPTPKAPRGKKAAAAAAAASSSESSTPEVQVPATPVKRSRSKKSDDASTSKSTKEESVSSSSSSASSSESSSSVIEPTNSVNAELANLEQVESPVSPLESLRRQHQSLLAQLAGITLNLTKVRSELLKLDQSYNKEYKLLAKQNQNKKQSKRKSGTRAPSGFVRPTKISDEMAIFLGKPLGTEIARTEVTRSINKYITENDLQDKSNRRRIVANGPLRTLLRLSEEDELTYFNLQKHMKVHFSKLGSDVTASPAPTTTA